MGTRSHGCSGLEPAPGTTASSKGYSRGTGDRVQCWRRSEMGAARDFTVGNADLRVSEEQVALKTL